MSFQADLNGFVILNDQYCPGFVHLSLPVSMATAIVIRLNIFFAFKAITF